MSIDITPIPGTEWIGLTNDANLTPTALREGTIILETAIRDLPEVQELPIGSHVIDVGAFIGDTALIFLEQGCLVTAFEPQPDAYFCLIHNTMRYRTAIMCINSACGNGTPVTPDQNPIDGNLGTRTVSFAPDGIRSMRLDDMDFDRIDFIKIDCEGFEPEVIRGGLKTIARFKPIVLCEVFHEMLGRNGFTEKDIRDPLEGMEYKSRIPIGVITDPRYELLFTP